MANLINNFVSSKSSVNYQINPTPEKPKPNFDIQRELDNRTFIKPLKGRGHLVNENIFNAPALMVKDAVYDVKAFKHAFNGDANDHELGRLNDMGLKMGGLAIAGYLFAKQVTQMKKGMEFVGLASFLASMAIWPKLAIQLPAKLIHGVNVQKEYEDSFGRKKPFYQDPQFIPWDLYSDEEINKIGDRLGVSRDLPNRREFIQEKMRKIAVQNNTLWMLTAGFATPVMSALICNQAEPFLEKFINNRKNKQADEIFKNFDDYAKTLESNRIPDKINKIVKERLGKPLDDETIKSILDALTTGMDPITATRVEKDLAEMTFLDSDRYVIGESNARESVKEIKDVLKKYNFEPELINAIVPTEDEMIKLFRECNFIGNAVEDDAHKIIAYVINTVEDKYNAYPGPKEDLEFIETLIAGGTNDPCPIKKASFKVKSNKLTQEFANKLVGAAELIKKFQAEVYTFDTYASLKVGAAPETVVANYCKNVSQSLIKIFGISTKEIKSVRQHEKLMGNLLRDRFEKIASNTELYNKVMKELVAQVSILDQQVKSDDLVSPILKPGIYSKYDQKVDVKFKNFADKIRELGFKYTADTVYGVHADDNVGTLRNIQKVYVSERLISVKSTYDRLINTLDAFRRIAMADAKGFPSLMSHPREVKEEIIELCKRLLISGHHCDYATKFWMQRNPHPNMEDMSQVVVENGKVINKYYGKTADMVNIPNDKFFYQDAMRLMYEDAMSPETTKILKNSIINEEVNRYRTLMLEYIGGEHYFAKPYHRIRPRIDVGSDILFKLMGNAPEELVAEASKQVYNTKKWLKMFGGFGVGLLGVTVLAQFFFGHMKEPKKRYDKSN